MYHVGTQFAAVRCVFALVFTCVGLKCSCSDKWLQHDFRLLPRWGAFASREQVQFVNRLHGTLLSALFVSCPAFWDDADSTGIGCDGLLQR